MENNDDFLTRFSDVFLFMILGVLGIFVYFFERGKKEKGKEDYYERFGS